ncbi:hypothetical protein M501DRAFT_212835 [Patellaria atrata CBS 101060]|uniref:Uncharacterized protein n=1 Tax=Patellaria atrata CBS 101060 TaxID=1346257 RepID=A0A9P4S6E5_9PEZI|nr:hypothetical protein M501DRAFT_212835 [Patellaria atrata CBS 101060]
MSTLRDCYPTSVQEMRNAKDDGIRMVTVFDHAYHHLKLMRYINSLSIRFVDVQHEKTKIRNDNVHLGGVTARQSKPFDSSATKFPSRTEPVGNTVRKVSRPKQTAGRSSPLLPIDERSLSREEVARSKEEKPPRPNPTARRGTATRGGRRGRGGTIRATSRLKRELTHEYDALEELINGLDQYEHEYSYGYKISSTPSSFSPTLKSSSGLGLINERYHIKCPDLLEWDYDVDSFTLILTLDGDTIWGAYDFGMFEGLIFIPNRPWEGYTIIYEFTWKGRENSEGVISYNTRYQTDAIRFLGDGQITGIFEIFTGTKSDSAVFG